jgi:hypothetical protein
MSRVRPDLSSREVKQMVEERGSGSAAAYLEARREELAAEEQKRRDKDDEERFIEQFAAAGGNRADALAARTTLTNERALEAARRADEAAIEQTRLHASRSL